MVQRITDAITQAITSAAKSLSVYTRSEQGLPITMVNAVAVAANTTQSVTINATVDCWINSIQTTTLVAATAAQSFNSLVSRITIAGFSIYENQNTAITPLFFDAVGGQAGHQGPQSFHGFPTPFIMRQGDVMTIEFITGATAVTGSVKVDAYRCSSLHPG
jgi:hypothetical protein